MALNVLHSCCMKWLSISIILAILVVFLSFAGKAVFGMEHGMVMDSVECVNHCINTSVFPVVSSTALPVLLFIVFSIACIAMRAGESQLVPTSAARRMTEPIRLFLLAKKLSPVMIRD